MKVIIALYESGAPFTLKILSADHPEHGAAFASLWPIEHMPLLVDDGVAVAESTIIIEHLDLKRPGPRRMIPQDPAEALTARFWDRVFDNYVMAPMSRIVFDFIRAPDARDARGVAEQRARLDRAYQWLNGRLPETGWACGDTFGLADCAAAPALFYADWTHPIAPDFGIVRAYRARLLDRPSVRRVVDEARPYSHLFPPGAPDRD